MMGEWSGGGVGGKDDGGKIWSGCEICVHLKGRKGEKLCSMYVWLYVCMYVCMYVCIYVCMYVCFYVCIYKCMYGIYISFIWHRSC